MSILGLHVLRELMRTLTPCRVVLSYSCLMWLSFHLSFAEELPFPFQEGETHSQEDGKNSAFSGNDCRPVADEIGPGSEGEEAGPDRPVIKRFGAAPLNLGEQEEATRLSAIAAKMGTDPTAIIGRFQTLFRHDALEGGSRFSNNLVGRIDVPYHKDFLLRADLPYVWSHPNQSGTSNQHGVSDLLVRAGGRFYSAPGDAVFAGVDFTFPTADDKLGAGNTPWAPEWQRPTYCLPGDPSSSCCSNTNSR